MSASSPTDRIRQPAAAKASVRRNASVRCSVWLNSATLFWAVLASAVLTECLPAKWCGRLRCGRLRRRVVLFLGIGYAGALVCAGQDATELLNRMKAMEDKIKSLEAEVQELKGQQTALTAGLAVVLAAAAIATYERNIAWSGAIPLWEDTVKKSPAKASDRNFETLKP